MRSLSSTLAAAQQKPDRVPAVSIVVRNLSCGAVNLVWERLYSGSEPDGPHALTLPADGSLIRLRASPEADNRKLYRQRVSSPGPAADFSVWTYLNQYGVTAVAACALGAEVSLFWAKEGGEIDYLKSLDNGVSWSSVEYPGSAPGGAVSQMAAAYKPNGDLALCFADASTLYIIKRLGGVWQSRAAWDKTTGTLSGVAVVYDGDWKLLVSGRDTGGNYKLWSLVYGDGGEVPTGTWSALPEMASAPADAGYEFKSLFLDKPDVYRCFFVEKYSGVEASSRPFWSHSLPGVSFLDNRWREPVPFDCESEYGLALSRPSSIWLSYEWLTAPAAVWRANLSAGSLDLSGDVLEADLKLQAGGGELVVELRNDRGQYHFPGQGALALLERGGRLDFNPGYQTAQGPEYSTGLNFGLEGYEHTGSPGRAGLVLKAADSWQRLAKWIARYQFRWNKEEDQASVKEILAQVLARAGLNLAVKSASAIITGFYPDFTIHAGDSGKEVVEKLLSWVPDVLFLDGDTAWLVNPLETEEAVYAYGTEHVIYEGRYRTGALRYNRVRVEGNGVISEGFAWAEIRRDGDILQIVEDVNLDTAEKAQERAEACLRKAEMAAGGGFIRIPVNCAQQLYDVVAITDARAGLSGVKRRVMGLTLSYRPARGEYEQRLFLGKV